MFKIAATPDELRRVFVVRGIVFVEEQACPYALEYDEWEESALHILGEIDGEPAVVGRMRFVGEYAKLERIAIRKAYRGQALGHKLVDFMLAVARERGYSRFKMHAQAHLTAFYQQHGFEQQGDQFDEAGIPHYLMVRHD